MEVLARIREISDESGLRIANLLHAGDGNLHPSVLFDERNRRFVAAALPELERGGAFVLAGALHLGGDQGMVRLLRGHGFTVERASLR